MREKKALSDQTYNQAMLAQKIGVPLAIILKQHLLRGSYARICYVASHTENTWVAHPQKSRNACEGPFKIAKIWVVVH